MTHRWLVIVEQRRPDLYAFLHRQLGGRAVVLLDRRNGDRPARRQTERRRALAVADAALRQDAGYHVVFDAASSPVEEANARAEVRLLVRRFPRGS